MPDKCVICGNSNFKTFHKGVRDNPKVDVLRCKKCGLLQLSEFPKEINEFYEQEQMHQEQYDAVSDNVQEQTWNSWIQETRKDDDRRFKDLQDICRNKKILDFGCGNGGFLRNVGTISEKPVGVELDNNARRRLNAEGILVVDDIDKLEEEYDVITMFQVLEHLDKPEVWLRKIHDKLKSGGCLIIETPNGDDALIGMYESKAFQNFTFWSVHLMLYNSDNLESLVNKSGFTTVDNSQIQRYPLSNHLYWLSNQKPGGHEKWRMFNGDILNKEYEKSLRQAKACDTLFSIFQKK